MPLGRYLFRPYSFLTLVLVPFVGCLLDTYVDEGGGER